MVVRMTFFPRNTCLSFQSFRWSPRAEIYKKKAATFQIWKEVWMVIRKNSQYGLPANAIQILIRFFLNPWKIKRTESWGCDLSQNRTCLLYDYFSGICWIWTLQIQMVNNHRLLRLKKRCNNSQVNKRDFFLRKHREQLQKATSKREVVCFEQDNCQNTNSRNLWRRWKNM